MKPMTRLIAVALMLAATLTACQSDRPEGILSNNEMEAVLYDYHLAIELGTQAEAEQQTKTKETRLNAHYYTQAALAKHGLKQADFERSLEWFSAHPEALLDIYKRLNERMAGELGNLPTPADGMAFSQDASADTTDIWQEARQVMLSSQANTHFSFQLQADTSFHTGDQLRLQFMSEWFYKEGQRSGTALLTIKYKDGTSQTGQLAIYGSGRQQTSVTIADKPIETIYGFFYQNTEWSKRPRILYLSGISLLRIHSKGTPTQPGEVPLRPDSALQVPTPPLTANQRIRDSLLRADSLNHTRPHFK